MMTINMAILKGVGKITIGAGAVGCGGIMIANGVGDIKNAVDKSKLAAAAAADATTEAAEDVDIGDLEDDLPEEPAATEAAE